MSDVDMPAPGSVSGTALLDPAREKASCLRNGGFNPAAEKDVGPSARLLNQHWPSVASIRYDRPAPDLGVHHLGVYGECFSPARHRSTHQRRSTA